MRTLRTQFDKEVSKMVMEIQISVRAYAKQVGVTESAIRRAIKEGKIEKGYNKKTKKIIPSAANKEYGSLKELNRPQRGVSKQRLAEKVRTSAQAIPEIPDEVLNVDGTFNYAELLNSITITSQMAYKDTIQRREIIGLALDRMKLEEQQGILVRKADVEKSLFALGDQLKKGLLNIPSRVVDDIMSAPNKIDGINILTMEIQLVLKQFSEMGDMKPIAIE